MIQDVILGDCFEKLKDLAPNSVDLIIIDPPYLTTSEKWDQVEVVNDILSKELFRVAKESCSLYVWCGIGEKSQSLIRWFPIFSKDWVFKDLITWKKQRGIGMRRGWLYTREELMWFVKDNKQFVWNVENQYSEEKRAKSGFAKSHSIVTGKDVLRFTNVWTDITESGLGDNGVQKWSKDLPEKLHFTPKPIKAVERIIKLHTKENDLILDCFAGSGQTGLAAKNLGRQFILIEKDLNYYNLIKERLNA